MKYKLGQEKEETPPVDDMNEIISLFHHIHHEDGEHEVHHCGGDHVRVDAAVDYNIEHCGCGKHTIDKQIATGHDLDKNLELLEVDIQFKEECPDGGWHIESGEKAPKNPIHEGVSRKPPQPHGMVGRCVGSDSPRLAVSDQIVFKYQSRIYRKSSRY